MRASFRTAAMVAALAAAFPGCGRFQSRPAVPLEPPQWATEGGNAARTSGDGSAIAFPLRVVWSHDAGRAIHAPPALADSLVFTATLDRRIMAWRLADGERLWVRADRGGYRAGLAAAGRFVYAATDGREGLLRCFDAREGRPHWAQACGGVMAAPCVADSLLVVAAENGLFAVDRVLGGVRWRAPLRTPVLAAPVVVDSTVVVASFDGSLGAWGLHDGVSRWTARVERGVRAAPVLSPDGTTLYVGTLQSGVEARDARTGGLRWLAGMDAGCAALVAVEEGVAALGPDGALVLLRADDGARLWRSQVPGLHEGALAVSGALLLVGGKDGTLRAFRLGDGAAAGVWDAGEPIVCAPVVSRSRVLVCGGRGRVVLLAHDPAGTEVTTASATQEAGEPAAAPAASPGAAGAFGGPVVRDAPAFPAGPAGGRAHERERERRVWSKRAVVSFAASLLAGSAAIWLRERADDSYARYLRSSDPGEMERHFGTAVSRDRWFAASWVGSQVGLAVAIYSLIRRDVASERPAPPERGWGDP